jgi:hypothetical protein
VAAEVVIAPALSRLLTSADATVLLELTPVDVVSTVDEDVRSDVTVDPTAFNALPSAQPRK